MAKNKLLSRFRLANRLLKIYQHEGSTGFWLRGVLYEDKWDTSVSPNKHNLVLTSAANFYAKDNEATEYRVREYFGMTFARPVTSDGYIDVNHRVIWTKRKRVSPSTTRHITMNVIIACMTKGEIWILR